MSWFTTNLIAGFLLPPLNLLLLFALGIFLLYRASKFAKPVIIAAFLLFWIVSTPFYAESALQLLERQTTALDVSRQNADAIVVLGAGTYFKALEYGEQDTVDGGTLIRLRYGAKLHRETGKPVLVTAGKPMGNQISGAQQMRAVLEQEFHIPVRWSEDSSDNTYENALYSYHILQKEGIRKIYLVTHGWHMPRSADVFRRAGFEVVEAPTSFTTSHKIDLLAFLPRSDALSLSKIFLHEVIGLVWYRLKSTFRDQ